uniref:Fatty acid synthase n=1 Tax=Cacopsylla melanoneura TaxID=428564 RepID=A0A8D8XXN1_9HEMI
MACPVVISGISGRFPESSDCEEFKKNLYNGVDMISNDSRRWPPGLYGAPSRTGKIKDIASFDAEFFGIHTKLANVMDPQLRMLLELTHESIMDAGYNPEELRGTRTGVYIGLMTTEANDLAESSPETLTGYETIGSTRAMLANRLSYAFNFSGPCCTIDTACSSTLFGLHLAVQAIERGECEHAIIGGVNLTLKPATSLMYHKYSMLSPTGTISPFDAAANGYVRSEAAVVIFITRDSSSRRIYSHILGTATNTDGHKKQGQTYPSSLRQAELMREVYKKSGVDPALVGYVEAHGTGTSVGDVQETNAITEVFCTKRSTPLLIGSVKSNCGHTEPTSGLVSIAKATFTFETGLLPPNINYHTPNPNIKGLTEGKLKVVSRTQPLVGDYIAINSFGVGGTNAHVLLKRYSPGIPTSVNHKLPTPQIPRLVLGAGRTQQCVGQLLNELKSRSTTNDLLSMYDQIHSVPTPGYKFRGFAIQNSNKEFEIPLYDPEPRPIWFLFSGMGSQWLGMGRELLAVDIFRSTIDQCDKALAPMNVSLRSLYENPNEDVFKNPINVMTGVIGMQIGLINILKSLGVEPDGIVGHSIGELSCSYADGGFTLEETILAAYYRGCVLVEAKPIRGAMVAVGLGWDEINRKLPNGIVAACHNSNESVTISGPQDEVRAFAEELRREEVFAKEVDSLGFAFHSPYLTTAAKLLRTKYEKFLKSASSAPPRTPRWISTSFPQSEWENILARNCSMDYHLHNVSSPVLFHQAMEHVPSNAIVIEIAPHPLLQAILKRSLPGTVQRVTLTNKTSTNHVETLLSGVGSLYLNGVNIHLSALYGKPNYPVPRGTPMISPLVKWDHSTQYQVPSFLPKNNSGQDEYEISLKNDTDKSLAGHKINSRVLYPAAGYLTLVWKALSKSRQEWFENVGVQFEDVRFLKPTILSPEGTVHLKVTILPSSGRFEITENSALIVDGKVSIQSEDESPTRPLQETSPSLEKTPTLYRGEIYKELNLRGYNYEGLYQGLIESNSEGISGLVEWSNDWTSYIDTILQFRLLSLPHRDLRLPTSIQRVRITPKLQNRKPVTEDGKYHSIQYCSVTDTLITSRVQIQGMTVTPTNKRKSQMGDPTYETFEFHKFFPRADETRHLSSRNVVEILLELGLENISSDHLRVLDLAEQLNLTLDMKNIIDMKPRKTVDMVVRSLGPSNPDFASNQIRSVRDISNDFIIKEEDKFNIILVDDTLDEKLDRLLQTNSEVCVLHVQRGEKVILDERLMELSTMSSGGVLYSLLFRASSQRPPTSTMVKVTPNSFDWVSLLQEKVKISKDIVLVSDTGLSGVMALVKCLNQEYQYADVRFRCLSLAEDHDLNKDAIVKQLSRHLVHNVYEDGSWGSYRHTLVDLNDIDNNNIPHQTSVSNESLQSSSVQFDPHRSYIVIGGLGGFGLELCDWMVQRNCRNLVLSSRSGIQTGYQQYMVNRWRSLSKVNVEVCTADVTMEKGAEQLFKVASGLGQVDGVFNLAGVLRDGLFENQTADNFSEVTRTKLSSTLHMDRLTRSLPLNFFVTFSSITSGRGNKGQTNYGFANAAMEAVCERRRREGLAGLAIQWGPISDVGMAAKLVGQNLKKVIGGAHAQTIDSCLASLDLLLRLPKAIVASTVVPQSNVTSESKGEEVVTPQKVIGDILGIQNLSSVRDSATLSDLGLDSLMAADVKNVLQSKFNVNLSNEQIKELKFNAIQCLLGKS